MRLRRARNAFPHARGALVHQLGVAPLAGQLRIESIRLTSWRNTIAFSRSRTRECEWRTQSISHSGLKSTFDESPVRHLWSKCEGEPQRRAHSEAWAAYATHFPKLPCLAYVPEACSGRTLKVGTATDRIGVDDGQTAFQEHGIVGGRERDGHEMQWSGLCFPQLLRP